MVQPWNGLPLENPTCKRKLCLANRVTQIKPGVSDHPFTTQDAKNVFKPTEQRQEIAAGCLSLQLK